ncbi:HD domain-containing protein [Alkalihalobacillus oceani]|uniref:HD domain-containing protein n=1 Tax=Halalkalibacter oceani TaxID=1653776 RepID=A0A9X2DN92_9BACI|nr:HD domain-containing phosphohydrolase [Halalkalibacter oceani]MCM3713418.1 HD domain-containing protein [Halalkalibacter oceani]
MGTYQTFVTQLFKYYFISSLISVIGVGGVLFATTLQVEQGDIPVLLRIVVLSFLIMIVVEWLVYRRDRKPIQQAFSSPAPSKEQLRTAFDQAHRFPMLTGLRVMGPHLFGLSLPALLLTWQAIRNGQLSFSYDYLFYALLCAGLISAMHAMIEYFKASQAVEPVLLKLQQLSRELYQEKLSFHGKVLVSIRTKFQLSALLIGAFPLLLFSVATQFRLSQSPSLQMEQFISWSLIVLAIGIMYGAWLLYTTIMTPLTQLTKTMNEVEQGKFDVRLEEFYSDEFAMVTDGFNHMVEGLEQREVMNRKMNESFFTTLAAALDALDARDAYTAGHSERVARYAVEIGRKAGFSAEKIALIKKTGLLHDIGKIAIPDAVLLKEGHLTDEEFTIIQEHPVRGEEILKQIQPPELMAAYLPGVRSHHERMDGRGYPDQLRGKEIPVMGRILAVADAYDAMTSDRPYRKGMDVEKAIAILEAGKGTQWDERYVDYFIDWLREQKQLHPEENRKKAAQPANEEASALSLK